MNRKLRLDQTKHYEQTIACELLAEMLVSLIEGREHSLSIGGEQGDIPGWDDFVIENVENDYTHLQVKRQLTDFSDKNCQCVRNKNSKDKYYDLSPLDKSMQSLANWIKNREASVSSHKFVLVLPTDVTLVKSGLEVRHLSDFCTNHIKETSTASKLAQLQSTDNTANNVFNWLNTWCDFENWQQILDAFLLLKIRLVELEPDIDTRSRNVLNRAFNEPDKVLKLIKSYIHENTGYTSELTPRNLLWELKNYIRTDIPFWTQFHEVESTWRITGTHDLGNKPHIERPSVIVPKLWDNNCPSQLKLNSPVIDDNLPAPLLAFFQLAIHLNGNSSAYILNSGAWKQIIKNKAGHTLGISESDFESLAFNEMSGNVSPSDIRSLTSTANKEDYSNQLGSEIITDTWKKVKHKVDKKISGMDVSRSTELRDQVEIRWDKWKQLIDDDGNRQKRIFMTMVYPKAENENINAEFRIGPKTVDLLAVGLFYQIIISTALIDQNDMIEKIDDLTLNTVAVSYWSGPGGNKARRIDDESVEVLVGKETGILILSSTQSSPTDIYEISLADEKKDSTSLAAGNFPKLLVTDDVKLRRIVSQGNLDSLRKHLEEMRIKQGGIERALNSALI